MGGGGSKPAGGSPEAAKEQKKQNMLLLGAPCVGKSTIFRQMKLLYRDGFTSAERSRAKVELRLNLITSLLKLDEVSLDMGLNLGSNSAEEAVTRLKLILSDFQYDERNDENCVDGHADDGVVEEQLVFPKDDVLAVWADPSIQKTFTEVTKHDFQLPASDTAGRELLLTALPYVLSNIERICENDFVPSDADCLHLRRHTTSVERISFPCEVTIRNKKEIVACTCTDIGGQAQEQLKWEQHAQNIDVIVFVASMADFDRVLEDGSNALVQQFALLRNVLEADCFGRPNVIVLLNKSDVLEEKLKYKQLSHFFPEFIGENTLADANKFYAEMGEALMASLKEEKAKNNETYKGATRQVTFVSTNGLDTELVNMVLTKALAASMCQTLLSYGLL